MTVAINNVGKESDRTAAPHTARAEQQDGRHESTHATAWSVALGSLLSAGRTTTLQRASQRETNSPSQMFEPRSADSGNARLRSLKAADYEQRSIGADPKGINQTGVEARRTDRAHQVAASKEDRISIAKVEIGSPNSKAIATRPDGPHADHRVESQSRVELQKGFDLHERFSNGQSRNHLSTARGMDSSRVSPSPAKVAAPIGQSGAHAVPGPVDVSTLGSRHNSVAERVGEVLATGRVGDNSTARTGAVGSGAESHTATNNRLTGKPGAGEVRGGGEPKAGFPTRGSEPGEFADLVKSIRLNAGLSRSSAKLQLHPPKLGRVQVDVQMRDNVLQISIRAEFDEATSILRERADILRNALEQYGIQVEQFDIDSNQDMSRHGGHRPSLGHSNRTAGASGTNTVTDNGSKDRESPTDEIHSGTVWLNEGALRLDIRV